MALYGVRLVINLFDLCIYRRYLEEFIGNRKTSMEFSVLLLIVCELIGSAVNQMGISWLNFVVAVVILTVYIGQYDTKLSNGFIAMLLYLGIIGITEPTGYLFSKVFMEHIVEDDVVIYYFSAFLVVIFRLAIVEVFCRLKAGKNVKVSSMPKETSYALALIPLCSLISCFLLIEVAKELISAQMVVLCMCIIFVIIITNYIIFLMIEKYTTVEEKQHEEEMIQREILYRNEYYQDMERYQEQIQDIRHDMKNPADGTARSGRTGKCGTDQRQTAGSIGRYPTGRGNHLFCKSGGECHTKSKKRKGKRERDTDAGYNSAPPESIRGYRGHGCSVWESFG